MTVLLRLIGLAVGAGLIWYGVDSLRINADPRSFTIEEIEQNGVPQGARFITVSGAQSNGDYFILEIQSNKAIKSVITPLFSSGRLQAAGKEKKTRTSLFYKTYPNLDCMTSKTCVQAGPVLVRGVVKQRGLFDLEASERISMQNSGYPLADKFVFVEEEEPNPIAYYLYLIAGVALIIASLLPKALYRKQF